MGKKSGPEIIEENKGNIENEENPPFLRKFKTPKVTPCIRHVEFSLG